MFGADMHDDNIPAYASKELDRRKDVDSCAYVPVYTPFGRLRFVEGICAVLTVTVLGEGRWVKAAGALVSEVSKGVFACGLVE